PEANPVCSSAGTSSRRSPRCRCRATNPVRSNVWPQVGAAVLPGMNPPQRAVNLSLTFVRHAVLLLGPCDPGNPRRRPVGRARDSHGRMDHRTGTPYLPMVNGRLSGRWWIGPAHHHGGSGDALDFAGMFDPKSELVAQHGRGL